MTYPGHGRAAGAARHRRHRHHRCRSRWRCRRDPATAEEPRGRVTESPPHRQNLTSTRRTRSGVRHRRGAPGAGYGIAAPPAKPHIDAAHSQRCPPPATGRKSEPRVLPDRGKRFEKEPVRRAPVIGATGRKSEPRVLPDRGKRFEKEPVRRAPVIGATGADQLAQASPDLLRGLLSTFIAALMGAEADALCGAGYRERSDERSNQRNGYRHRDFDTRAATIDRWLRHGCRNHGGGSRCADWTAHRCVRGSPPRTGVGFSPHQGGDERREQPAQQIRARLCELVSQVSRTLEQRSGRMPCDLRHRGGHRRRNWTPGCHERSSNDRDACRVTCATAAAIVVETGHRGVTTSHPPRDRNGQSGRLAGNTLGA